MCGIMSLEWKAFSNVFESQIERVEAFVMSFKTGTSLVFLTACLTVLGALPASAATSSAIALQNCHSERALRSAPRNQSELSAGTNAQRVRPNHRSATASELPRQLCAVRARSGPFGLYKKGSLGETSSAYDPLCRLVEGTAAASEPRRTVVVAPCRSS